MRRLPITIAAFCLASPLGAQDGSEVSAQRTPENAQKFLSAMASQHQLTITITPLISVDANRDTDLMYAPIVMTAQDRCTTEISGPVWAFYAKYVSGSETQDKTADAALLASHRGEIEARGVKLAPYLIEWGKLTAVGTATLQYPTFLWEQREALKFVVGGTTYVLYTPSPEVASRIRLAMETLKTACDKTEGLGF